MGVRAHVCVRVCREAELLGNITGCRGEGPELGREGADGSPSSPVLSTRLAHLCEVGSGTCFQNWVRISVRPGTLWCFPFLPHLELTPLEKACAPEGPPGGSSIPPLPPEDGSHRGSGSCFHLPTWGRHRPFTSRSFSTTWVTYQAPVFVL